MTYDQQKKDKAVVIAAIITALIIMLGGMISGLVLKVRLRRESETPDTSRMTAEYLLRDSAYELRSTMSALRLCNEKEPAENLSRTGLVHAVRAEAALECRADNWADNRSKEAFLNDIATVLHMYAPERMMEMSELLYDCAERFYSAVSDGGEFVYNGELGEKQDGEHEVEITEKDVEKAKERVTTALKTDKTEHVGNWNGHIEFNIERDGKTGYAVVCGEKIQEFAFMRDGEGGGDTETAKRVALEAAEACGYPELEVRWCEVIGRSIGVIMCKSYDGALACDDYASAVVFGGEVMAFTAGGCDCEHENIPTPKKSEREARGAAKNGGEGALVVRTMNGEERICYEYRYELEDGVHYVYVCAESGKQIDVK